jgi:hypothetical protein
MICPHIVNFGLFFGAIISWGFLYPFLETKRGQWYQTDSPTSLNGQNGYKVCTKKIKMKHTTEGLSKIYQSFSATNQCKDIFFPPIILATLLKCI